MTVHQKAKGPIDPTFGKRVRRWRMARGMTQATLAGKDFSKGFISLVERGHTRLSLRAAEIFAARLHVELSLLHSGKPLAPTSMLCTRCGGTGIDP